MSTPYDLPKVAPVEVTTRFATSVDDLAKAWQFVMSRIDMVGPNPMITIKPVWVIGVKDDWTEDRDYPRHFEVVVEGMVQESKREVI